MRWDYHDLERHHKHKTNGYEREAPLLKSALEYLAYHPQVAYVWRNNTGAMKLKHGNKERFIRFGVKGLTDILGFMKDGRILAIEMKIKGKHPTDEQWGFICLIKKFGGVTGVAYSLDDVKRIVEELSIAEGLKTN